MRLKVGEDWFAKKAELEGDLEVGVGGSLRRAPPPYAKAMLFGMAAAPAAA